MDDLMGMFGNGAATAPGNGAGGSQDLMNGFASMDLNGGQPPPAVNQLDGSSGGQAGKKTNDDLLGLF